MSDYRANRRANLLALEKRFGTLAALEERTGVSASYLSQLKKFRHMGDKTARRLEKKLNLPEGWMDGPPAIAASQGKIAERIAGGKVVSFEPDQRVQHFLEQYLNVPEAMRAYLEQKLAAISAYLDKLTPFQRKNMSPPPTDPKLFAAWEKELEEELARSQNAPGGKADNPTPRQKSRAPT